MGSLCVPSTTTKPAYTSTLTNTTIPEWVSQGGQDLFEQSKSLAMQPYQTFPGARMAPFNNDQLASFDAVRNAQGIWEPMFDEGSDLVKSGSGAWTDPGVATSYMNPYTEGVIDNTIGDINRQYGGALVGIDDAVARGDSWGGGRQAVLEAENNRNRVNQIATTGGQLRSQGYESGRAAFENDQRRALSGGQQLMTGAGALSGLAGSDAAALEAIGSTQQNRDDASLGLGYSDFLRQQQWPYQQLNFALGALKGVPYSQTSTSNSVSDQILQNPSIIGQGTGALGALYGAYKLFGQ